jgi:lysophospholipase L1-like esterase
MRILVFGDSITQGIWDSRTGWVGYMIEDYNAQYLSGEIVDPPSIFNLGISGDTSRNVLNRFESEVQARRWKEEELCFIFLIGVNNTVKENNSFWSTPKKYKDDLAAIIKKAKIYSYKIIFLGLTGCDEAKTLPVS